MPTRRLLLLAALAATAPGAGALPRRALQFPRDFGSHPELRTEWWYVTGHARAGERVFGFQVTFFRTRVDEAQAVRSAFAARQLVFAHAALTDLEGRRLRHDQRIARAGFGVAFAGEADTDLRLRDWQLAREGGTGGSGPAGGTAGTAETAGAYRARIPAEGFALDLRFESTQAVLLQGEAGLSRKGPDESQASYYYSEPQLKTSGRILLDSRSFDVRGTAWLDHEWSEALLHPSAVGWDWIGMNLDDGRALTAFRLRRADGSALWHGGSLRGADGRTLRVFRDGELRFEPLSRWTSPRTRATYPTSWRIHTPAGDFTVRALLDDQELDSRGSTGAVYWEGLSELRDAADRRLGLGYLELTGYAEPLKL